MYSRKTLWILLVKGELSGREFNKGVTGPWTSRITVVLMDMKNRAGKVREA